MSDFDQPWWYAACLDNIQKMGGVMCGGDTCFKWNGGYAHAYCNCLPPYSNGCAGSDPPPGCCAYSETSPIPFLPDSCYCCCGSAGAMALAFGKDQYKAPADFQVGDPIYVADDISLKTWRQRRVMFSAGAGDLGAPSTMLKVTFGVAPAIDSLIVTRQQLFLTPLGLKPAAALVPGEDVLTAIAGDAKPVIALEAGTFRGSVHQVATDLQPATSVDGHLVAANGVVCGDWSLQIALATNTAARLPMAAGLATMPEFGTRAYAAAHPGLGAGLHRAAIAGATPSRADDRFQPSEGRQTNTIPTGAFCFLTAAQASDIEQNAPVASPASQAGKDSLTYLFKLFGAFYPYIDFTYDEFTDTPNAYLYGDDGQAAIVVTGGLARVVALRRDGLACVIGTLVAATTSGPPKNEQGWSCLGTASYGLVTAVLPNVWPNLDSVPVYKNGKKELAALFGYIDAANKGGSDTCMGVSCDCRLLAMQNAFHMLTPPPCAGGPVTAALEVVEASGTAGVPLGTFKVTFNLPVDPTTATALENYTLDPAAKSFDAAVAEDDPKVVLVDAELVEKTTYKVTASGVLSNDLQPLVPLSDTATFEVS